MRNLFVKNKNLRNSLFVFFIAFFAFFAFEPLFKSLQQNAAQEFASAIFGTIFAAVITMVLLSKQTETEEEKSRNEKVFEEKISLYNIAIESLQEIFKRADDKDQVRITRSDIIGLEFILAKLIMVADEKTIHEFRMLYQNISKNYSPKTGILNLTSSDRHTIFRFADYCREELGLWDKNIEKEILDDIVLDGELFYHLEEEAHCSPDILSILKNVYGYVVFDLFIPLQRITFQPDGFEVYQKDNTTAFVKCRVMENELLVTLLNKENCKMKNFKFDDENRLHIGAKDRNRFLEDFPVLQKALYTSRNN